MHEHHHQPSLDKLGVNNPKKQPLVRHRYTLGEFMPLIVIFSGIILFTIGLQAHIGIWSIENTMRFFMGGFFLVFGAFKVANWRGFVDAYQVYDIIAKRVRLYGYLYPLLELYLGISYLYAPDLFITNVITIVVMSISSIGVYNEIRKNNQIPCACLGVVFIIPMTYVTLVEDILMAVMAAIMLLL